MGQALRGGSEDSALSAGVEIAERVGAYLARQRKLRGVSLDELESLTRIPKRSLERLEAGVFDADRDAFARGFVRTVASALGLDATDAVARMLPEHEAMPGARIRLSRPVAVTIGTGLLVALAIGAASALWQAHAIWPKTGAPAGASDVVRRPNPVYTLLPEWHARQIDVRARVAWEAQLSAQDAERAAAEADRARAEAAAARARAAERARAAQAPRAAAAEPPPAP